MNRPSPLVVAGGALAGVAVGAVLWSRWRFPVRHRSRDVARLPEPPPLDVPDVPGRPTVQREADGTGARFHRRYRVRIAAPGVTPEDLVARVVADPDAFVAAETARFEKTHGVPGPLALGDEYEVHPSGPWRAPVRVAACDARSFTLVTLAGPLDAGRIRFSAASGQHGRGVLTFTVESWARSATPAVDVAYDTLGVAQKAQQATWTFLCQAAATASGGRRLGPVEVLTEREPEPPADVPAGPAAAGPDIRAPRDRRAPARLPVRDWEPHRDRLEALRDAPLTVDLAQRHTFTEAAGWHVDHTAGDLPPEPPGAPLPAGTPGASWAAACTLVRDYTFPDPDLVTGLFAPDGPVAGRPMLLRARFAGLTFWFGVRVGDEIDETVDTPDGPARDWGYGYATLAGHFERGEITFRVRKHAASGRVEFRVDAVSRPERTANPFHRLGFAIFGRRLQRRFAETAVARMQVLTAAAIAS